MVQQVDDPESALAHDVVGLWEHQRRAIDETLAALAAGKQAICVTSPTGMGKTRIAAELVRRWLADGLRVGLYTNRRLLVEQTSAVMEKEGVEHGVRAAGHETNLGRAFQISSVQTEGSRVLKSGRWALHDAQRVLIDEAHLQTGRTAQTLLARHLDAGAAYVGLTATPIDLLDVYDVLIQAGTVSEGRACGALVRCDHFGPDEPDLKHVRKVQLGEDLSEAENVKAMMVPGIFGRVMEWWKKLNPEGKPTILFAPGVKESLWFAEQFHAAGVSAAHIDGEEVWVNGETRRTNQEARGAILDGSRTGRIAVLCNRFVLREGIDAPWLSHGVFATVFGSLQSYLQSGGRLLRAYPGISSVTLQDHGGNWHRHGSLNADRDWRLDLTASMIAGMRADRMRQKKEKEPVRCPKCAKIIVGFKCPCGYELKPGVKSRPVFQADGALREYHGDIYKPRPISKKPNGPDLWKRMYYRSRTEKGSRTFRAAAALFAKENNFQWPDPAWPFMPTNENDWFKQCSDVDPEKLTR